MDKREEQFKRMVLAYLHDPPHKVLDLGKHEEFASTFIRTVSTGRAAAKICGLKALPKEEILIPGNPHRIMLQRLPTG